MKLFCIVTLFPIADTDRDSLNVGGLETFAVWIIMGAAGGMLVVLLVVVAAIICCRRRRARHNKQRFLRYILIYSCLFAIISRKNHR